MMGFKYLTAICFILMGLANTTQPNGDSFIVYKISQMHDVVGEFFTKHFPGTSFYQFQENRSSYDPTCIENDDKQMCSVLINMKENSSQWIIGKGQQEKVLISELVKRTAAAYV